MFKSTPSLPHHYLLLSTTLMSLPFIPFLSYCDTSILVLEISFILGLKKNLHISSLYHATKFPKHKKRLALAQVYPSG